MIFLTIRTDKPESELGLYKDKTQLDYVSWAAHRQLAETIHSKIKQLLDDNKLSWSDINGVVCYAGPGSFTGLRIGLTVGNSLAQGLEVPIIATNGSDWQAEGTGALMAGKGSNLAVPDYGAEPHITKQKK